MVYEQKTDTSGLEFWGDLGGARQIDSQIYLIAAHQMEAKVAVANKRNKIAIFEVIDVRKLFCDLDGIRYPKYSVSINFDANDYLDQHREPELFYKEFDGEAPLNPFETYPDIKKICFQINDLGFQVHPLKLRKTNCSGDFRGDSVSATEFILLIRYREIKKVWDGNKTTENEVFQNDNI